MNYSLRAAALLTGAGLAIGGCVVPTAGTVRLAGLPAITSALDPNARIPSNAPHFLLAETVPSTTPGWKAKEFTAGVLYTTAQRRKPYGMIETVQDLLFLDNGAVEVLALSPNHDMLVWSTDYDLAMPPRVPELTRLVRLFSVATGQVFADLGDDFERYPLRQGACLQDTLTLEMKNLMTANGVSPPDIAASEWIAGQFVMPVGQTAWMDEIAWTAPDELRIRMNLEVRAEVPPRRFSLGYVTFDVLYRVVAGQRPVRLSCTVLPSGSPSVPPGPSSVSGTPRFTFRGQTVLQELPRGQNGPVPLMNRPVNAFLFPDPPVP